MSCVFCAIAAGEAPAIRIYEDDGYLAILDFRPFTRGHTLVVPKQHTADLADTPPQTLADMVTLGQRIARAARSTELADATHLGINDGRAAFQSVNHIHLHVLPRRNGDNLPAESSQLLGVATMLLRFSMGWPAFLLCVSGLAWSLLRPQVEHRRLWWMLLPAASYFATFLAVVGYAYDRFLLPVFPVFALAGGFCASRLDRVASIRRVGRAGIVGVLAFSVA